MINNKKQWNKNLQNKIRRLFSGSYYVHICWSRMNLYQTHMNCSVYLHSMPIYMKLNAFALGICFCHRSFLLFARIFGVSSRVNQRYKKKRRIRVNVVCVYVADQWSCLWRIHTRATNVCYYCKLWMVAWRFCGVRWHEELLDRSNTVSYVRSRIEYNYWMDHLCVCCLCSWASFNRASSDWIEWMHILEEKQMQMSMLYWPPLYGQ